MDATPTVRVMGLHALEYCERLFYLEEVEEIRVADQRVWAGRRLHLELDEDEEVVDLLIESETLGIRGKVDAVRRRDGLVHPVEHKRGRARRGSDNEPEAWPSDQLQAVAYAMLLEEHLGTSVPEARIRYHADNCTVRLAVGEAERAWLREAVRRARELASSSERPPVTDQERRCVRCSLAPVCLPEEARLAEAVATLAPPDEVPTPVRLYAPDVEKRSLHVTTQGARVGRSSLSLKVTAPDGNPTKVGIREVSDVVVHGFAQVTTQALRLCASEAVPVHYLTTTGGLVGSFAPPTGGVQRRIRQFSGLSDTLLVTALARRLVMAKIEMQLRALLRATRKDATVRESVAPQLQTIRAALRGAAGVDERGVLLGHEGTAARAYFLCLPKLVASGVPDAMRPAGRTRRPPRDRFNALLSFAYSLLNRDVLSAILRVGLEPAFGVLHTPRSAAYPLVLDITELFRVPVVDMAILAAVNRRTFDPDGDFEVAKAKVWLSDSGRKKLIEVYERRKHEEYRHPVIGYALSYARMMEVETRLLEKEWSGEPGMFARFRIR